MPASNITASAATVRGSVALGGFAARYYFEYGSTTNYGAVTATNHLPASGTGLRFNGTDQFVATSNSLNLSNLSFTVEAWARRAAPNRWDLLLHQGSNGPNNNALHFGFRPNNKFTFAFWGNDLDTPAIYTDDDWHHWAGTFDAVTRARTLYCDGVVVATDVASSVYQGAGLLNLARSLGTSSYFGGDLDEVRLWNTVRSPVEIIASMNGSVSGSEPGQLAAWRFAEGTGTTTTDATANACTGTLINSPLWLNAANLAQSIAGLPPNTTFHFRVVALNSSGFSFGANQSFTTLAVPAPQIAAPTRLRDGNFRIAFTSVPGAAFTVLASTNVTLPRAQWTVLGPAVESSSGQFQFTDLTATNHPIRFYHVTSP
jgi:hypothetical protein